MALDTVVSSFPRTGILQAEQPEVIAWKRAVNLVASTTYIAGQAIGELTATPGTFGPYNSAGGDGTQNPTAVLHLNCTTDASGNVTIGTTADPAGLTRKSAPAWFGGVFNTAFIYKDNAKTALDATLAGKLGKLLKGTVTAGLLSIR